MTMTLDSIPLRLWCGGAIARCLVLQRSQVRPHYPSVLHVGPKILWENVRNILLSMIPQAVCISLEAYWLEGPVGGLLPALLEALHRLNYLILFRGAMHQFSRFLPVTCLQYASPFTPPKKYRRDNRRFVFGRHCWHPCFSFSAIGQCVDQQLLYVWS